MKDVDTSWITLEEDKPSVLACGLAVAALSAIVLSLAVSVALLWKL